MLLLFIIILSIWFNHIWILNNESFILSIFLIIFFLIIYIFLSFSIKSYFFSNVNYILNLLKYSNIINIYIDKIICYNISIKNKLLIKLLSNKNKLINVLVFLSYKFNNLLFSSILNFFLVLKRNLFKVLKNNKLLIVKNSIKKCEIIL
jgi:hypothetical protein